MSAAVKPMQEAAIRQYAKQLHLPTLGGQFARLAEQAVKEQQSQLSYLEALLEGEVEERGRKAMARRIQEARFPAVKTLEEFDFQCASHIPMPLLRNLSEGGATRRLNLTHLHSVA
jgi:DNA replication protein DnaC